MNSVIKLIETTNYFNLLEDQLGGQFFEQYGEKIMSLNNDMVKGTVKAIEIKRNEFFFEFDLNVRNSFRVSIPPKGYNAINFLYCQKGSVKHLFGNNNAENEIAEFQTAIVAHKNEDTILEFEAASTVKLILISICSQEDRKPSPMIKKVYDLFLAKMKNNKFAYFGSINLKISEQINSLNTITETGLVRKLMIEGMVQLILGMEIQHHKQDIQNKTLYSGSLTRRELSTIQDLGLSIKDDIAAHYCIDDFISKTGISAAKLQEGFKLLYGRTITDYIKNLRVEESERLIKNSDLNVSQIVYTIGFSSRSYFSKIFRKKYGCSPIEYLNKCRVSVAV